MVWVSWRVLIWKDKFPRLIQHSAEILNDILALIQWTLGWTIVQHEFQDQFLILRNHYVFMALNGVVDTLAYATTNH
jgi:soluble P-type ATPase